MREQYREELPNVNKYNPVIKRTIETIIRKGDYSIVHVNIPGHVALMTLIAAQRNNVKIRIFHCHKGDKFDLLRKINVYFRFWREWILGKKMASKLKNEKYDFVYTNTRFPVVGASIAKKLAIPHITHIREFGSDECFQGPWTPKTIYNCSDKVVLISKALYNTMASKTPSEKLIMIHNGISGDLVNFWYL